MRGQILRAVRRLLQSEEVQALSQRLLSASLASAPSAAALARHEATLQRLAPRLFGTLAGAAARGGGGSGLGLGAGLPTRLRQRERQVRGVPGRWRRTWGAGSGGAGSAAAAAAWPADAAAAATPDHPAGGTVAAPV